MEQTTMQVPNTEQTDFNFGYLLYIAKSPAPQFPAALRGWRQASRDYAAAVTNAATGAEPEALVTGDPCTWAWQREGRPLGGFDFRPYTSKDFGGGD